MFCKGDVHHDCFGIPYSYVVRCFTSFVVRVPYMYEERERERERERGRERERERDRLSGYVYRPSIPQSHAVRLLYYITIPIARRRCRHDGAPHQGGQSI